MTKDGLMLVSNLVSDERERLMARHERIGGGAGSMTEHTYEVAATNSPQPARWPGGLD
jgi:hypothetical protein